MNKRTWFKPNSIIFAIMILLFFAGVIHSYTMPQEKMMTVYGRDIIKEIPLAEAVEAYNQKYPDANPLTEAEVIAAIRNWDRKKHPVKDAVYALYLRVAEEHILPPGMYFSQITKLKSHEYVYEVNWKDLTLTAIPPGRKDPEIGFGYNHRIRARFISSRPITDEEKEEIKKTSEKFTAASLVFQSAKPIRESNLPYEDWFSGPLEKLADLSTRIGWLEGPPYGGGECQFLYRCSNTEQFNEALKIFSSISETKLELFLYKSPEYAPVWNNERVDWTFTIWNPERWEELRKDKRTVKILEQHYGSSALPTPRIDVYIGGGSILWEKVKVPENVTVTDKRGEPAAKEISPVLKEPQAEVSLPEEISEFYKKWNFVSSLSTPEEQTVLLSHVRKQETPPGKMMENERLKKVYESIMELGKCELTGIDPDFTYPRTVQSPRMTYDRTFSVYEVKKGGEEISVAAVVTTLAHEFVKGRIARYEKKDKPGKNLEGPVFQKSPDFKGVISPNIPRKEIHIWKFVDRKWMRTEISYDLLKMGK